MHYTNYSFNSSNCAAVTATDKDNRAYNAILTFRRGAWLCNNLYNAVVAKKIARFFATSEEAKQARREFGQKFYENFRKAAEDRYKDAKNIVEFHSAKKSLTPEAERDLRMETVQFRKYAEILQRLDHIGEVDEVIVLSTRDGISDVRVDDLRLSVCGSIADPLYVTISNETKRHTLKSITFPFKFEENNKTYAVFMKWE